MRAKRLKKLERQLVFDRAMGCCEYCLCQDGISPTGFSIEHIIPLSKGGTFALDNLALACQECNNHKYTAIEAIDPQTETLVPIYHPRIDLWADHFAWSEDFLYILAKTPTANATIELLQLNRLRVVRLRRALILTGEHPPILPPHV
jgi:HNH endonuclease